MRKFSVRPTLTLRGRTFKGLRGWAGKPSHPPFTDFPVAAYVLAAVFDVISVVGGHRHAWAQEFFHAGTFVFIGGAIVSLLAALTGWWDWRKSSEPGNQARRTINTHAVIMITVTVLALADIVWRLADYHTAFSTPVAPDGVVARRGSPGFGRRHLRWQPGVRLRLQRGDGGRPSGLAHLRRRRPSRPALIPGRH
jgi:uncharacterized membrane protein